MGCINFILLFSSFMYGLLGRECMFRGTVKIDLSSKLDAPGVSSLDAVQDSYFNLTNSVNKGIILLFDDNRIRNIPSFNFSTGVYRRIVRLDLSYNRITDIPSGSLDRFICLQTLSISFNNLESIASDALHKLKHLENLSLRGNNLWQLQSGILGVKGELTRLKRLDLSQNNISRIMNNVFHEELVSLMYVNLSHNSLETFEPWPYIPRTKYMTFNLQYNKISTFTNQLNWTTNREYYLDVKLGYNRLKYFRSSMFSQYLGGAIPSAYNIVNMFLNMDHNPWLCDCGMHHAVSVAIESFYAHRARNYLTCDTPGELKGKDFGYFMDNPDKLVCNLTKSCPHGCTCEDQPHWKHVYVDCSNNDLTVLPKVLPSGNLYLDFSNNSIIELHNREYVGNISVLNVSFNRIVTLTDDFLKSADNLTYMDIRNNSLQTLPITVRNFAVQSIRFTGNHLVCTCDTLWLGHWIRLYDNMTTDELAKYVCFHGDVTYKLKDVTWNSLVCYRDVAIAVSVVLAIVLVLLVTFTFLCCRYKYEMKVLMFDYFHIHPFDHAPCDQANDSTKLYDVYLSIDRENEDVRVWVKDNLLKRLEKPPKKSHYVYYPCRQDNCGDCIADQMVENINKSRRVIAVVNNSYISNGWSMEEFDHSHRLLEETNSGRLLILVYGDLDVSKVTQEPLKSYLSQKKWLHLEDKWMWKKISYELPYRPLPSWTSASRESLTSGISSIHATLSESSALSFSRIDDLESMSCEV